MPSLIPEYDQGGGCGELEPKHDPDHMRNKGISSFLASEIRPAFSGRL